MNTWDQLTVGFFVLFAAVLVVRMACAFKLRAEANSRLHGWHFWVDEMFRREAVSGLAETHEQFFPQSWVRSLYRASGKIAVAMCFVYVAAGLLRC